MQRTTFYVGVNAIVVRDGKILLGKRKGTFGDGDYGLPGGHLEFHENMQKGVARELLEETGMTADSFTFSNVFNNPSGEKHYLQIGFVANNPKGEPKNVEPDRCYGWEWFPLHKLPENITWPHIPQIEAYLKNRNFTDSE
jgi:8-oxo-dGTP diphosphatase